MSKRKALGGDASDEEYAVFPYVISGMEREIRALKRQVQRLENLNKANESYFVPHYYSAEDLGLNDVLILTSLTFDVQLYVLQNCIP